MSAAQIMKKAGVTGGGMAGIAGLTVYGGAPWWVGVVLVVLLVGLARDPQWLESLGQYRRDRAAAMVVEAVAGVTSKANPSDLDVVALVDTALRQPIIISSTPPAAPEADSGKDPELRPPTAPPPT